MNIRRWLVAIVIIIATIAGLGFVKYKQVQAAIAMGEAFPEPSASVKTMVTQKTNYQPYTKAVGQALAPQVVMLQNELGGVITKVGFIAGEKVTKGQVLLSLEVSQEVAQLNAAKANHQLAKNTLARMQKLLTQKKISQQEFDASQANYQVAKANIANLKSIIAKKTVIAPFDGQMSLNTFQVGQYVAPQTAIGTLVGTDTKLWVEFKLPQTMAKLALKSELLVKTIGAKSTQISAQVIAIDGQMGTQARQLKYRAQLDNQQGLLRHNEMVSVHIPQAKLNAVVVPNLAIGRNHLETYVYQLIKDAQGQYRAQKVAVTLGERQGDNQLVTSGLESDVFIATEGAFKLREGLLVYPQKSADVLAQGVN